MGKVMIPPREFGDFPQICLFALCVQSVLVPHGLQFFLFPGLQIMLSKVLDSYHVPTATGPMICHMTVGHLTSVHSSFGTKTVLRQEVHS